MDARVAAVLAKDVGCSDLHPLNTADPIELSNACRAFYQTRLQTARSLKEKWGTGTYINTNNNLRHGQGDGSDTASRSKKKSSIDVAIETLKKEMTSLMEQDLSLMKQLLTLNEEIEELKWRRKYCWSRSSVLTSSGDVDLGSATDFTESETSLGWRAESGEFPGKYPGPSSLSLQLEVGRLSVYDEEDPMGTFNRKCVRKGSVRKSVASSGQSRPQPVLEVKKGDFGERESFDSGIHEGFTEGLTNMATEVTHL
ncbi:uncharacterized protein LOC112574004 [Pomacea canaliculata]|nr:uncharacterized protein LOC112574004 [Pomacea canaliculata]XP_025110559.1 uncharacterized protein LOC112574004 [Pomacea canaliculata]